MATDNANKDDANNISISYIQNPTTLPTFRPSQPNQLPSGSNLNLPSDQQNSIFPGYNPCVPTASFPYSTISQRVIPSLSGISGSSPYPDFMGIGPNLTSGNNFGSATNSNRGIMNSSVLRVFANSVPRQLNAMGIPNGNLDHDTAITQGSLNQWNSVAEFLAAKGDYANAINYYEKITEVDSENGAAWSALGHCYLLVDNLKKAFNAYQNALFTLTDIRDPQLWFGIGLLYEKV